MNDIKALQLLPNMTDADIDPFLTAWYEWRTYGLVIKNLSGDVSVDFGDWIIALPDGTFAQATDTEWGNYMMSKGILQCMTASKSATNSTKTL